MSHFTKSRCNRQQADPRELSRRGGKDKRRDDPQDQRNLSLSSKGSEGETEMLEVGTEAQH